MVFSFFKKPPPEKMVAKAAAAPVRPKAGDAAAAEAGRPPAGSEAKRPEAPPVAPAPGAAGESPAAAEARPDLAPLDFTSPSEFSDLSETPGDIHVENDIDPVEAEIEQAAVLYANAQDDLARTMLEGAVHAHPYGPGERLWLMLFDLYRVTAQQAAFEALSIEFARTFEKSPPSWREAPAPAAATGKGGVASLLFKGGLTGDNDAAFAALDQALDKSPRLRADLSKITTFDDLGCERLLGVLAKATKKKCDLELIGRDALIGRLEQHVGAGRAEDPGVWLLLLDLYQLQGRQETFEEMAIQYAVTFEMSPPSWDPKRVARAEEPPAPDSAEDESPSGAYVVRGEVRSSRFPDLPAYAEQHEVVVLDFSEVTRLDFVSAGTLTNLLGKARNQGKRIAIRHPNHLVSELLAVVGVTAVAELVHRKS